ncbi:transmembrane protein, putative (macronuclear) [Tetrahymena thermophila SB210]|uniref:Transmembrane protein, putative n=1 Tax=Tetrahymena thermophila (strain SB210) TaxID=312017 RepID=W7X1J2_TETTS|nr:transmembrane protein, putative [Tetrahymena thermophila SB210]EWS71477.1 transmembrane protein, putative [Tetrahymena thermophila SB210]|eukprot:XP_012655980.1 transmembrane protein, putative [Tetrahymena thermophila SB210]
MLLRFTIFIEGYYFVFKVKYSNFFSQNSLILSRMFCYFNNFSNKGIYVDQNEVFIQILNHLCKIDTFVARTVRCNKFKMFCGFLLFKINSNQFQKFIIIFFNFLILTISSKISLSLKKIRAISKQSQTNCNKLLRAVGLKDGLKSKCSQQIQQVLRFYQSCNCVTIK